MIIFFASLTGCDKDDINVLSITPAQIDFDDIGGSASIQIDTDAKSWNITNQATDWVNVSSTTGTLKNATVTISVTSRTLESRSATLVIDAGNAKPKQVTMTGTI